MKKILLTFIILLFLVFKLNAQISITFTNVVQPCNNNGSATAIITGGVAPYTYNWTQSLYYPFSGYGTSISTTNSISNVPRALYFLAVTDANNNYVLDSLYMPGEVYFLGDTAYGPGPPVKGLGAVVICPTYTSNLALSIGGINAPYTFSILTSTQTTSLTTCSFNNLIIGDYTCTVTDNMGCTDVVPVSIYSSPGYYVNITSRPDTCTSNGTATAMPVGGGTAPFAYLWNTTPPQSTQTAIGLSSYNYSSVFPQVTVTDANGCVVTSSAYVQDSITSHSIQSVANIYNATCAQNNGAVSISNSGGMPPYAYLWSTGATTDSISNLYPGTYYVTVSDAAGCHERFTKHVQSISPVYTTLSVTNTNCSNLGGAITTSVSGGTAPYTYNWSNTQTTSSITNLGAGFYAVDVRDVNGCYSWAGDSVFNPSNCVAKISGRVFNDMNGNCALDANESGLPQQIIQLNNGTLYYSDWTGKYYIPPVLNPTVTYTIMQTPKNPWVQVCPSTAIILNPTAGNTYPNNDFYDRPNPLYNDLQIYIETDSSRPGFTFNQYISVFNNGTSTMTGTASLQHDALLNIMNVGGASAYNSTTHTFTFSFNNLAPMTWASFAVSLQAPSSATLFTPLASYVVANPVSGDVTPQTNYDTLNYRVTGSYDPNAKSVKPEGVGTNGYISTADSVLNYVIHFQNTGSYPTNVVSVIDTIDSNLDIYSLKVTGSYTGGSYNSIPDISFLSNNVIKFNFNYCHLQPAQWDVVNSSGYITYTIQQRKNLSIGTQIKNRADIYFDYNTAILTNLTLNTINATSGIKGISTNQNDVLIYPNPSNGKVYLSGFDSKEANTTIEVTDVTGKLVYKQMNNINNGIIGLNLQLTSGVYFVRVINSLGGTQIKKLIINY